MRATVLILLIVLTLNVIGQQMTSKVLSEKEYFDLQQEDRRVLKLKNFKEPNNKATEFNQSKYSLKSDERLFKIKDDQSVMTIGYDKSGQFISLYTNTSGLKSESISFENLGSVHPTPDGFFFLDYSHGQGCEFTFYDESAQLINRYSPGGCFLHVNHLVTKNGILIVTQNSDKMNEGVMSLLTHSGELVLTRKFQTKISDFPKLTFENGMYYMLLFEDGGYRMRVFNDQLENLNEYSTGFIVRQELFVEDESISYLTRENLVVKNSLTGQNKWEFAVSKSLKMGMANSDRYVVVLSQKSRDSQLLTVLDYRTGKVVLTSSLETNVEDSRKLFIESIDTGFLLYNGKDVTEFEIEL